MGKRLVSLLGGLFLGAASLLPNEGLGQQLSIGNNWSTGSNESTTYIKSGSSVKYTNTQPFKIYDVDDLGNQYQKRGVNTNSNNLFKMVLEYRDSVANGITNKLNIQFKNSSGLPVYSGSSFPSNIVVTMKVISKNGIKTYDLGKECVSTNSKPFFVPLPTTSNAIPGGYATNYLSFATKESSSPEITNFTIDSGNATIRVNDVLPGENIILESKTNLTDLTWTSIATNYIPVTPSNFGTTTSTIFSNIPTGGNQEFFKIRVQ